MDNLKDDTEPPPSPTTPPCDCCQLDIIIFFMTTGDYGVREAIAASVTCPDWIALLAA